MPNKSNVSVMESLAKKYPAQTTPRLNYYTKILYGVGDIANVLKTIIFGLFTLYFYTSVMGLPGTFVGIASAIGLVWDAVIDPYIGYLSDKARFRFGRRHTFMLVGALTMGGSFWAFFSPPQGLSSGALFAWLLGTSLLVRTTTSVYCIPYYALGAELSPDYHERTSITGVRGIMALLGALAAASLSFVVFFPDKTPGVDPKLNYAGYSAMGLTFGLVMAIVGLIATLGSLEWRPFLSTGDENQMPRTSGNFFVSLVQSLRNRSFFILFASFSLFFLGVVINASLSIHYLTYYVKITASSALSTLQLAFYVGGIIGVVFWLRISGIVEKQRLYFLATLATAALMLGAFLLVGEGHLFGTGNVHVMVGGHALGGFFASVLWFIPYSMVADVADEDELVTGRRREGSFFGIFSFGQQIATGLSVLLIGLLIDWFAGLIPGHAQQSALTMHRIAILYSILPAILLLMAAALTFCYTLDRSKVVAIQRELDKGPRHGVFDCTFSNKP